MFWLVTAVNTGGSAHAQPGTVLSHQKISDTEGGFKGDLESTDSFGSSITSTGDLDGDGIKDLAVGAVKDDDGGFDRGAVWILFLDTDGTVRSHQKISDTEGGFTGTLDDHDWFGSSVASLGDLDGDGVGDLAVGMPHDDDEGTDRGAVWILFLNPNGTVKAHQKINDTLGGFTGALDDGDRFGASLAVLGDMDGNGVDDLAVGAPNDDDGGDSHGAVWILFLNADGTVKSHQKISEIEGGFTATLDNADVFGFSVASLGDLDGDDVTDLAVGAIGDDDGSAGPCDDILVCNRGAVWVLFLNADGTVKSHQKISDTDGGFAGTLDDGDFFGWATASLRDLDSDGVSDLTVGARFDHDGDCSCGAVWVLFLKTNGTVKELQKISSIEGGFAGVLDDNDWFGSALASLGDHNGDDVTDLAVGATGDDDGGVDLFEDSGAVWVLFLDGVAACPWDLDDSGDVGVKDLLILLGAWGPCPPKEDCPADFDDSGDVGVKDLLILLGAWGPCS